MLKPSSCMTLNVPMIDIGSVRVGMTVATMLRRKRKITRTTRTSATTSENFTSLTDCSIDTERSYCTRSLRVGGSPRSISASAFFTALATATVFVPGCRSTANPIERSPSYQLAVLLF